MITSKTLITSFPHHLRINSKCVARPTAASLIYMQRKAGTLNAAVGAQRRIRFGVSLVNKSLDKA